MRGRCLVFAVLAASFWSHSALSSDLEVVGTGDGMELLQSIAAAFSSDRPGHTVIVPPSIGSGGAVTAVGAERNPLGRIARPLTEPERAQGLVETPIMRIPSAIYAHRSAGVTGLTAEQLTGIYSGAIQNWKEVGGNDLRIKVVRRPVRLDRAVRRPGGAEDLDRLVRRHPALVERVAEAERVELVAHPARADPQDGAATR